MLLAILGRMTEGQVLTWTVSWTQVEIFDLGSAKLDVDAAIATAIKEQKPVYINICCNIACGPSPPFIYITWLQR